MLLFWSQHVISMAFFVYNSKAGVQAWNQKADVSIFWNLANCNSVYTNGWFYFWLYWEQFLAVKRPKTLQVSSPEGGGALECNLTGRCPFFTNLHNPFRKKICISTPCFGIFKLQNDRENNSLLFLKIAKTIAYCFRTNSHNPFRNFWSIFIPGSGLYAEKWYPARRHVPYRFIWKCPHPLPRGQ